MSAVNAGRIRAAIAAAVCFLFVFLIGMWVRGGVPAFDLYWEQRTVGTLVSLAAYLSMAGYARPLIVICLGLVIVAVTNQAYRARALFSIATVTATHFVSDWLKHYFDRPRPEHWLIVHETTPSYPSGHAATSAAFYALWAYWILRDTSLTARPRAFIGMGLAALAYGICWSRIALGAHWPTDVAGGFLLGLGVVFTAHALAGDPAPPVEDADEYEEIDVDELEAQLHGVSGEFTRRR